jgi:hypothetical protein
MHVRSPTPSLTARLADFVLHMQVRMETSMFIVICAVALLPYAAAAQTRGLGEFQITKITKNLISAPQFTYTGAEQYQTNQRDRWLEMEVEFSAAPEFTDELTFKYYILFNGKLLTGEVRHSNIAAGTSNRSVMYISPRTLARFGGNRPVTTSSFQNVAVQIEQQGVVKDELSLLRTPAQ